MEMHAKTCDMCGKPLAPNGSHRCQSCWNLEADIACNRKLARKVYDRWELEQWVIANPTAFLKILQSLE